MQPLVPITTLLQCALGRLRSDVLRDTVREAVDNDIQIYMNILRDSHSDSDFEELTLGERQWHGKNNIFVPPNLVQVSIHTDAVPPDHPARNQYLKLFSYLGYANFLKLLNRFVHEEQPQLQQRPLPDGSNLPPNELSTEWKLRRWWIRSLHYPGLVERQQDTLYMGRIGGLGYIYATGLALLEREIEYAGDNDSNDEFPVNRLAFTWIARSRHVILSILEEISGLAFVEERPLRSSHPYTREETFQHNITTSEITLMNKMLHVSAYYLEHHFFVSLAHSINVAQ